MIKRMWREEKRNRRLWEMLKIRALGNRLWEINAAIKKIYLELDVQDVSSSVKKNWRNPQGKG